MNRTSFYLLLFCAGILLAVFLPLLPAPHYWPAAILVIGCLFRCARTRCLACLMAGLLYHVIQGHALLSREIPKGWEGRPLWVEGRVRGFPRQQDYGDGKRRLRFELQVDRVLSEQGPVSFQRPLRLRLSWFGPGPLQTNERWRLRVELQRPRSLVNPGGFDYRVWLLARGIGATGKVLAHPQNDYLGPGGPSLSALREWYRRQIQEALQGQSVAPLIAALALGDRQQLEPAQRRVLSITGTAHLMVISGLHIGLSALAGYAACYLLFAWRPSWVRSGRAGHWARVGGLLVATSYAGLSGFALPARRALVMLVVFFIARSLAREVSPWQVLLLSLCAVLMMDPLAGTAAGCWLSFGAVGLLVVPSRRRFVGGYRWLSALRLQFRLLLGMCPLLAAWLGQMSAIAPLVNFLAIPLVGTLLVPLLLAALFILPISPVLGQSLLQLAAWLLDQGWQLLSVAAAASPAWSRHGLYPSGPAQLLALLGTGLYLLPRGLPGRQGWPLLFLPLFAPASISREDFNLTVMDVGQGTAVVVQVAQQVLIYDAGPAYLGGFDAGASVLLPYLRRRGIDSVDRLVVSHADSDHSGGAAVLLKQLQVTTLMAPAGLPALGRDYTPCRRGQSWQWRDVTFEFLHPHEVLPVRTNNQSCVLLIDTGSTRYLLAGDIERSVELELASRLGPGLDVDVLLVPHHGSRSSSSWDFVWFTRPAIAVISAGNRNPFGHPSRVVLDRYREVNAEVVNTARAGALHFSEGIRYSPYRWFYTRYWQNYPCELSASARSSVWLQRVFRWSDKTSPCLAGPSGAVESAFMW